MCFLSLRLFNYKITYNYSYLLNRYQVLAFATDADKRQETEQQKLGSGKRLIVRPFLIYKNFSNVIFNHQFFFFSE